jgi:integrase
MKIKITQTVVDKQRHTTSGTRWLHDVELRGFCLAVGMTTKTFYASTEYRGRSMRRKVGRSDVMTAAEARNEARSMLADMRRGIDPKRPVGETLGDAFKTYLARKRLKASTIEQYEESFRRHFEDWKRRPVADLTRADCDHRHRQIGRRAPYLANRAFRTLQAVINDARKRGIVDANPCDAVAWYPESRRQTRPGDKLPQWWAATERLDNPLRRACLRLMLFTGFRRMEVCRLKWSDVDFEAETVLLRDRKRGPDIVLPLSKQAVAILRDVRPIAEQVRAGAPFCFPSHGRAKHIVEPNDSTIPNSCHDLRREFLSTAAELGISLILAKAAIGHSLGGDTTQGYMVGLGVRDVIQQVADAIERRATPVVVKLTPEPRAA